MSLLFIHLLWVKRDALAPQSLLYLEELLWSCNVDSLPIHSSIASCSMHLLFDHGEPRIADLIILALSSFSTMLAKFNQNGRIHRKVNPGLNSWNSYLVHPSVHLLKLGLFNSRKTWENLRDGAIWAKDRNRVPVNAQIIFLRTFLLVWRGAEYNWCH